MKDIILSKDVKNISEIELLQLLNLPLHQRVAVNGKFLRKHVRVSLKKGSKILIIKPIR